MLCIDVAVTLSLYSYTSLLYKHTAYRTKTKIRMKLLDKQVIEIVQCSDFVTDTTRIVTHHIAHINVLSGKVIMCFIQVNSSRQTR